MKVHIITGGGSGIGLEIAKRMKDGLVVISGRGEDKLIKAIKELESCGIKAEYKVCDITKKEEVKDLFNFASAKGELQNIVNSAGVSGVGDDVDTTLSIDLLGSKLIVDEAYANVNDNMVVVLISSMMGHAFPPNEAYNDFLINPDKEGAIDSLKGIANGDSSVAYSMSKRGALEMVKANAERFGEKGARIVSVSPGIIMTAMAKEAAKEYPERMAYLEKVTPAGRTGDPEDIANMVEFLVSKKASFITGSDFLVDGGLVLNLSKLQA